MWRVRVEGELLVLQVYEPGSAGGHYDNWRRSEGKWRDAKVQDIPVLNPFEPSPKPESMYYPTTACGGSVVPD